MNAFRAEKLEKRLYRIKDPSNTAMYLVLGDERAFLIDTGLGYKGLRHFIEQLTDKPVTVLLSHGHVDHASGIYEFDDVWMNPDDQQIFRIHSDPSVRKNYLLARIPEAYDPSFFQEQHQVHFADLKDAQVFDAGNCRIRAVSVPGHTRGIMVLILPDLKKVIFGDAIGPGTLMLERQCPGLSSYFKALRKLRMHEDEWDSVLRFHGTCVSKPEILDEMIDTVQSVMSHRDDHIPLDGKRIRSFPGLDPMVDHCYQAFRTVDTQHGKMRADGKEANLSYRDDKVF